ncbi:hypothetical protein ABIC75_003349 [Dyella japonica]|uniref:Uncharacterized protein n=1 Tax=Dyella japonica TaxID=231455 RepID=A0ABV2JYF2_9GAMM
MARVTECRAVGTGCHGLIARSAGIVRTIGRTVGFEVVLCRRRGGADLLELRHVHRVGIVRADRYVGDLALVADAADRHGVGRIGNGVGTQRHAVGGAGIGAVANRASVGGIGASTAAHGCGADALRDGVGTDRAAVVVVRDATRTDRRTFDAIGQTVGTVRAAAITERRSVGTRRRAVHSFGIGLITAGQRAFRRGGGTHAHGLRTTGGDFGHGTKGNGVANVRTAILDARDCTIADRHVARTRTTAGPSIDAHRLIVGVRRDGTMANPHGIGAPRHTPVADGNGIRGALIRAVGQRILAEGDTAITAGERFIAYGNSTAEA